LIEKLCSWLAIRGPHRRAQVCVCSWGFTRFEEENLSCI